MSPIFRLITAAGYVLATTVAATTAAEPPPAVWVLGVTDLGPVSWLEIRQVPSEGVVTGVLSGYAEVGMRGFDAPIFTDVPLDELTVADSELRASVVLRGQKYTLSSRIDQGLVSGAMEGGGSRVPVRGWRTRPISADDLTEYVGIFSPMAGGGADLIVTWREFGGLRVVEAATGAGDVLDLVEDGVFAVRTREGDERGRPETIEIERRGTDTRLVWTHADGLPVEYGKRDDIVQERLELESDGLSLRGTLIRPLTDAPTPAVVLVHGSGPIYRSALVDRALQLTDLGAAAFVYDKRGAGLSEGDWSEASFDDLAMDAAAALKRVAGHPGIDPELVGFQGHSQAGWVIPMATRWAPETAFAIVVSGGPIGPAEQTLFDKANDLRREGFDEEEAASALELLRRVQLYIAERKGDYGRLNADYLVAREKAWFSVLDLPHLDAIPSWEDPPEALLAAQEELIFDPGAAVASMPEIPMLVLLGGRDETVSAEVAASAWTRHWSAENGLRIEIVPDADHGFRHPSRPAPSPRVPEYTALQREWWQREIAPLTGSAVAKGSEYRP